MRISKEDKANFPAFMNHQTARKWFKAKYGNRFVMTHTDMIDGTKIYYYNLVTNKEAYLAGRHHLEDEELSREYHNSFQSVEVSEHGQVQVFY